MAPRTPAAVASISAQPASSTGTGGVVDEATALAAGFLQALCGRLATWQAFVTVASPTPITPATADQLDVAQAHD